MSDTIKLAIKALESILPYTEDVQDSGPMGEGWKSSGLCKAISDCEAALDALRAQPAPPPECQTDAEKTAYAFGWWKGIESVRAQADTFGTSMLEISNKQEHDNEVNKRMRERLDSMPVADQSDIQKRLRWKVTHGMLDVELLPEDAPNGKL